ncbi:MAG: antitoxin VapB family protein [Candidatus Wukongarchaeota archaeon]|nr:antitoxin VapB family protein [Candidatus Wukongarchaeota archaeon]
MFIYFLSCLVFEVKMDKKDKVKISIRREIANKLKSMKKVGDTYSDVIKRLLNEKKKNKN